MLLRLLLVGFAAAGGIFYLVRNPPVQKENVCYLELPEIVTNLSREDSKFMKLKLVLELRDQTIRERLDRLMPHVQDKINLVMYQLTFLDIQDPEMLEVISDSLKKGLETVCEGVTQVLIKEFYIF